MKKFTGNFLLGEHRLGNVLRKIGLSMVVILMAVTVFAQPAQETLHVWAEDVSDCYRYDNDYEVQVSFNDFVKIDTFVLVFNYDATVLSYIGFSDLKDTLAAASTFMITETSAGVLQIEWDSNNDPLGPNATLVGHEVKPVFVLHFELDAFPETYLYDGGGIVINDFSLTEALEWGTIKYWNDFELDNSPILTTLKDNGSLTVTQEIEDVVVDAGAADCDGLNAVATVTSPAENGYTYSFNGATFLSSATTNVTAPSTENTVRVMEGACVSYYKEFDVTSPAVLDYSVDDTIYTPCPGGLGDIQIIASGGTPAYTYFVIPIADTAQVIEDLGQAINAAEGATVVAPYGSPNHVAQVLPGEYWVAVQDANDCHDMRDLSWWTVVTVIDDKDPWAVVVTVTDLKCHVSDIVTAADGIIDVAIAGGTPFVDGYNVWFNDVYQGRKTSLNKINLIVGDYPIQIADSLGCDWDVVATVDQPDPIVFEVMHTDAFICPNDQAGIFEIEVVSGGTPWPNDLYQYKWEAYEDEAHTMMIDSLSDGIWGFAETFLGYAGIHYRVFARDYNDCETTRDTFIQEPAEIMFTVQNLTCFDDLLASARVSATGTAGREFRVLYKEIENDIAPDDWTYYNGWFTESIDIMDNFIFDNENIADVHYAIVIEDTLGCRSSIDTITFDLVQHPLVLEAAVVIAGECTSDIEITVTGGTPYVVTVDGDVVTEMAMTLAAGSHDIVVTDAHLICVDEVTLDVAANPVVRDDETVTFIGETVAYADVEAGIDTMLAEGEHTFMYMFDGCERTLNVVVVGVPRPLTIAEVQGEGDTSPWVDAVVTISGTVTGVAPGEGFFMQDANAANGGIWVEYSAATSGGIQIGNGVEVVGTVAEVASVTTIIASEVTFVAPVLTVVAVDVASPSAAEAEMYESVLVKVSGARATAVDAGTGEWIIYFETIDDVVVNDWLFSYTPVEGDYYNVTGIVNARLDAFKVEPRKTEDIENVSTTPAVTIESVQFKVYPNPFNDRIYIDNNDKLTRVVVSNIAGQRVIDVEYPSREIRTANLVSGVYVVSMFTENGIAKTERIVKR